MDDHNEGHSWGESPLSRTDSSHDLGKGQRDFPPFVGLEIAQYLGDGGCYLLHVCGDGSVADTWHSTLEEAIHQAEWELGVQREEWQTIQEGLAP